MLRITSITCALALSACALETGEETESTTIQAAMGCPTWGCGENSPVMGPFGNWWELNNPATLGPPGAPNNEGIQIFNFQIGSTFYRPEIVNGSELRAVHASGAVVTGLGLTNGKFNILTPGGAYQIEITKVNPKATSNVKFWVGPADRIETYELFWTGPGGAGRVCENPPPGRDAGEGAGHSWVRPLEAIFFTGDRYNGEYKRVTHSSYPTTTGWFNIGCAGSVLAKLHLNRHTTAGSTGGWNTSANMRQTLLKMYVSDVCGTGNARTDAGTPLHFEHGWMDLTGVEWAVEAQWGPEGVICWNQHHRLGSTYLAAIEGDCGWGPTVQPKFCDQVPADFTPSPAPFFPGAYIVSAVPSFVP